MPLYTPVSRQVSWDPTDQSLVAWAFDPALSAAAGAVLPTAGLVTGAQLYVRTASTINNIIIHVTAGGTLTNGQCFAGLYQNNQLLGSTADQAVAWASNGVKTMALTAPQTVAAGYVDVCFFFNGGAGPTLVHSAGTSSSINLNLAGTAIRSFTADAGRTTTLAGTLGTKSASTANGVYFAALS